MQVRVEVETCEELRPMNTNQKGGMAASYASGGQYGFSDKVVDGITLTVNSVLLTLKSRAFIASFQVSLFLVYFWFVGSGSRKCFLLCRLWAEIEAHK